MFNDWYHWISSLHADQLLFVLVPMLLFDAPRYALSAAVLWIRDLAVACWTGNVSYAGDAAIYRHCPSVCVVVAGLNEADTLGATLASIWGTYPRLQIIVVDDGSSDDMTGVATRFARQHAGVLVLRKPVRGGKSSALNFALPYVRAEVVACVDSDSHLGPNAIWEIVQPLADPQVGAVSSAVLARNPTANLVTRLQAWEYLRCIFLGRMFTGRAGILGIVSGAFGAFRREAIERTGGWDVGPGEDGDLVLRVRKSGYQIRYAPYAQCYTNLPTSALRLAKQRRRWEWALITFETRKHVDMADPGTARFRWSDLWMLMDRWTFNLVLQMTSWGYLTWLIWHWQEHTGKLFLLYYLVYLALELLQAGVMLYYSGDRRRVLTAAVVIPLSPLYQLGLRAVQSWALIEELLFRRSFQDNFVPPRVRSATWHW